MKLEALLSAGVSGGEYWVMELARYKQKLPMSYFKDMKVIVLMI